MGFEIGRRSVGGFPLRRSWRGGQENSIETQWGEDACQDQKCTRVASDGLC